MMSLISLSGHCNVIIWLFDVLAFDWRFAPILASREFLVLIFVDRHTGRQTDTLAIYKAMYKGCSMGALNVLQGYFKGDRKGLSRSFNSVSRVFQNVKGGV